MKIFLVGSGWAIIKKLPASGAGGVDEHARLVDSLLLQPHSQGTSSCRHHHQWFHKLQPCHPHHHHSIIITISSIINPLSGRESPSLSRHAHESTPAVRSSPSYWITAASLAFDSHTFTPEIIKFLPPWQGFLSRQRQQCPPCCAPKHNPQPLLKKVFTIWIII